MQLAIETTSLTKRFGQRIVLEDCNLQIPQGAVYGFLGANGAGKSTTIRILLGLLEADAGSIHYFGRQAQSGSRPYIGAVSDARGQALYDHLTAEQNLAITLTLRHRPQKEALDLLELVGLSDYASEKVAGFSTGMRQRLAIARALIGHPEIVILDEPLNGLDPQGIRSMRELIANLVADRSMTLIICSHLLDEMQKVASHVGLLHQGHLISQGLLKDVLGNTNRIAIELEDLNDPAARQTLMKFGNISYLVDALEVETDPRNTPDIAQGLIACGARIKRLEPQYPTLENLYHEMVRQAA
ncbi:ABC transporter ATP-binding protein [Erythrobacter sp. HA6-11]